MGLDCVLAKQRVRTERDKRVANIKETGKGGGVMTDEEKSIVISS